MENIGDFGVFSDVVLQQKRKRSVKACCHRDSNRGSLACKTGLLTTTPRQLTLHFWNQYKNIVLSQKFHGLRHATSESEDAVV